MKHKYQRNRSWVGEKLEAEAAEDDA